MTRNNFCRSAVLAVGLALLSTLAAGLAHATNSVGWALFNQPNAVNGFTPDPKYSFNSAGGAITITKGTTGAYGVQFENLATSAEGVVQVSGYNTSGFCISPGWSTGGGTVYADVDCYDAAGHPANAAFTVLYQARNAPFGSASKGVAYTYDNEPSEVSYTPTFASFNSTGGTNTIKRNRIGNFTVTLPGLAKLGGDVQVTAKCGACAAAKLPVQRCKVASWDSGASSTDVTVQCYTSAGAPSNAVFSLAYAVGEPMGVTPGVNPRSAWAYANDLVSTTAYEPNIHYQYNGFGTGRLTARKTGTGLYTMTIPGTLTYATSVAMVTATGAGSGYCNLVSWTTSTINVACFNQGGIPADSRFEVSLESAN